MTCRQAKSQFSPHLDGRLNESAVRDLELHLNGCGTCRQAHREMRQNQSMLATLGRRVAPANLDLRLRVAISNELARVRRPRFEAWALQLQYLWRSFAVPAASGLASAVLVFSMLIGIFAPQRADASSVDVPLLLSTPPELEASSFGTGTGTIMENSLLVEVLLDEQGRVFDYRVVSASGEAAKLLPQVKSLLLFTEFRPAMTMGRPTLGRALLTFSLPKTRIRV